MGNVDRCRFLAPVYGFGGMVEDTSLPRFTGLGGMPESPQNLRTLVVGGCGCLVEERVCSRG